MCVCDEAERADALFSSVYPPPLRLPFLTLIRSECKQTSHAKQREKEASETRRKEKRKKKKKSIIKRQHSPRRMERREKKKTKAAEEEEEAREMFQDEEETASRCYDVRLPSARQNTRVCIRSLFLFLFFLQVLSVFLADERRRVGQRSVSVKKIKITG